MYARCTRPSGEHPKMKEDIEAQGKLKRARLDSAKKNSQLMDTNIEELGSAELRDSQVQTKVIPRKKKKKKLSKRVVFHVLGRGKDVVACSPRMYTPYVCCWVPP